MYAGELLTISEVMLETRLARTTIHHHLRSGGLPSIRLGKSGERQLRLVRREDLER